MWDKRPWLPLKVQLLFLDSVYLDKLAIYPLFAYFVFIVDYLCYFHIVWGVPWHKQRQTHFPLVDLLAGVK